jgi:glycosyltransferase involved in cell wall biosynthesis
VKTIAHIGFSGLGGVSDLICTLGGNDPENRHHFLLSGIEAPGEELLGRLEKAGMPAHVFVKKQGLDLDQARRIGRCLADLRPDLIIAHGMVHLNFRFFHRPKCPLVVVEHQNFYLQPRSYGWRGLLMRPFISAYLFTTEESRRLALERYGAVFRGKPSWLIPNPIDPVYFEEVPGLAEEPHSLVMCGRLMVSKDHATVIRALHRLRGEHELHFYITGHGETRPALEALVDELGMGGQVTFCGILPLADLIALQRRCGIYVQSSEGETLSIAVLNALALRKRVVGSDVSGINNLLRHGENGFLFRHGDVDALCRVLREALSEPHTVLREQARQDALRYHPRAIVAEYREMIEALTKKN